MSNLQGVKKAMTEKQERRYWLWVARPQYYLNASGADRPELAPRRQPATWWTCHKNTKKGDLVLFYRSGLKRDIRYLLQVESDARLDDEAQARGWDYVCEYRSL